MEHYERIWFWVLAAGVLPGWTILLFRSTTKAAAVVNYMIIPPLCCVAYVSFLCIAVRRCEMSLSPEWVWRVLQDPAGALACWIHLLVFDLIVGSWVVCDGVRHSVPIWIVKACVVLTAIAGPLGFTLYILARAITRHRHALSKCGSAFGLR
jgi:hypothetical protein